MPALDLTKLPPPVSFPTVADIVVDKARGSWKHFIGGGSHKLANLGCSVN